MRYTFGGAVTLSHKCGKKVIEKELEANSNRTSPLTISL